VSASRRSCHSFIQPQSSSGPQRRPGSVLNLWKSRSAAPLAGRSRMRCKAMSCGALQAAGCAIAVGDAGPAKTTRMDAEATAAFPRTPAGQGGPRIAWPLQLRSDLLYARTRVKCIGNWWCLESVPHVAGDRHPGLRALKSAGGPEDAAARNSSRVAENGVSPAANARNRRVRRRYLRSLRRIYGGRQAAGSRIGTGIRGPRPSRNPGDRSTGRLPPFFAPGVRGR
jgi:hypothetical protein